MRYLTDNKKKIDVRGPIFVCCPFRKFFEGQLLGQHRTHPKHFYSRFTQLQL